MTEVAMSNCPGVSSARTEQALLIEQLTERAGRRTA
jgi:hypothetical protein